MNACDERLVLLGFLSSFTTPIDQEELHISSTLIYSKMSRPEEAESGSKPSSQVSWMEKEKELTSGFELQAFETLEREFQQVKFSSASEDAILTPSSI